MRGVAGLVLERVLRSRLRFFLTLAAIAVAVGTVLAFGQATGHHGAGVQPSAVPARAVPAAHPQPPTAGRRAAGGSAPSAGADAWLPFTQQDLAAAGAVTVKFCADYNTYSYTESAAAYVGAMNGLITGQLATTLQAGYSTPEVAKLRTSQKQVSTGTAAISSLRAFGPSSLTFIVQTTQRLVTSRGATSGSTLYAVTVTGSGRNWQVDDIELESAGNS